MCSIIPGTESSETIKYPNVAGLLRGTNLMAKKLKSVVPYFQSLMKNDVRQVSTEIAVPAPLTSPRSP